MKIVILGGGSYLWAFGFVRQFIRSRFLRDVEVVLVDRDPAALQVVRAAADVCNQSQGCPVRIDTCLELEEALDNAAYVLACISTGGLDAMRHDLAIPERYGIYHTVGDTVGPGGWLRAVRNISVFHDLGAKIQRRCPNAWLINVSNPLTPLTRVPQRDFGIKTIGMCPGVEETARILAQAAGAHPTARLDYVVTGIDHGSWLISLHADGLDVLARLKEMGLCRGEDSDPKTRKDLPPELAGMRAALATWREIGYLPSLGDRHVTENWPWFLTGDSADLGFGLHRTTIEERQQSRHTMRDKLQRYAETADESLLESLGHGDDPVLDVIHSLEGHQSFLWGSNYTNVGQIPSLPTGAVVETRCRFDSAGVHPLVSPMPDILTGLVLPHVLRQERIIDLALAGTFDDLVALITTDPLCSRLRMGRCRAMVREMLEATRPWIRNPRLLEFT